MKPVLLAHAIALLFAATASTQAATPGIKDALSNERIGLLDAGKLQITDGNCSNCASSPQSLWYFQDQAIAVPGAGVPIAGFTPRMDRRADITAWAATPAALELAYPSVTWIGAREIADSARLSADGVSLAPEGGAPMPFQLAPKLSTNRSYANATTMAYFSARPLRLRGDVKERDGKPTFVARTIWPADYAIDGSRLTVHPVAGSGDLDQFVRDDAFKRDDHLSTRLVWEKSPGAGAQLANKPVLGLVLNGAQGDDDESLGGHFAVATGRFGAHGEWADWAVNNFYNLDAVSEKGILAGTLPMDNYLMDLNSGQQYYRPSYMLVAVLKDARTAVAYQGAVQRSFNHFYRHDMLYEHAANNCSGISIDVFRALGWHVPERGPTSRTKAVGAWFYVGAKEGSLKKGRNIYDYLTAETTRLYPSVAFDALGVDLLQLVGALPTRARTLSPFEQQLKDDVEAIVLVKIPQLPSSRVTGSRPAASFDDYMARVPADQAKWQVVPVGPRPFPAALRDAQTAQLSGTPVVPLPVAAIGMAGLFGGGAWWRRRRKQARRP